MNTTSAEREVSPKAPHTLKAAPQSSWWRWECSAKELMGE